MLKNKWKGILSSVVILLPMAFGLIVWDKLPEVIVYVPRFVACRVGNLRYITV